MRESPLNNNLSVAYSYIAAVDLRTGSVDVLKSASGKAHGRYEGAMNQNLQREQVRGEVAAEYQDIYLDFINMTTVAERLKGKGSLNCIFQRQDGKWTLSAIVPQAVDEQGNVNTVLIANRDITDLKNWEQKQKQSLEQALGEAKEALAREKKSTEIISAISSIYWAIYIIHLDDDTYEEVKGGDVLSQLFEKRGRASDTLKMGLKEIVAEEDQEAMREFLNLKTLPERMEHETTIVRDYRTGNGHWHMARFIVKSRDAHGRVNKVLFAVNVIDESKQNELNYQRTIQDGYKQMQEKNMILNALADDYEDVYICDLFDDCLQIVKEIDTQLSHDKVGEKFCYSTRQEDFCRNYAEPEYSEELLEKMSRESLLDYFKDHDQMAIQYKVKPNQMGYTYMESRLIKVDSPNGCKVVMGSRKIDDIVRKQEEQNEKLRQMARQAEVANATKTDFLRRMSHDIRTPINGIRGMVQIANHNTDNPEKLAECREKIWTSTEHLLSLVSDVLDMNKLESGEFTVKHEPFTLQKILDEVHVVAETQAQEMGIQFVHQDTKEIEHNHLIGSPVYLKRIVMNFTSNAIKYNRRGGRVNVYGKELSFDGKTAWFEFVCEDTGIGMSEEFQKRAFEPFSQEGQSQARTKYQGTGLGLAISKSLIELLGGNVELHSVLGEGTKIVFRIPLEVDLQEHTETEKTDYDSIRFDGKRVLLAEDNELNAEIAAFLLEQRGMQVTCVENGKLAVEAVAEHPDGYDVLFMDIMMPVMDGLEATRVIRQELKSRIPIFAMTANAFTDDIKRSLDAGMNEHLTKPLQEKNIVKALMKYL